MTTTGGAERRLVGAYALRTLGSLGNGMLVFVAPVLIYQLTGSLAWSGLAFVIEWLPRLTSLPTAGPIVETYGIRRVFLVNDTVRVAAVAVATVVVAGGHPAAPVAVVAAAALAGFSFEQTFIAIESVVARTAAPERMHRAQGVLGVIEQGSLLVAPAIGGLLLLAGPAVPLLATAATFVASLALATVLLPAGERPPGRGLAGLPARLLASGRHLVHDRPMRIVVATTLLLNLTLGFVLAALPALVVTVFGRSPGTVGLVLTLSGAGAVVAIVACRPLIDRAGTVPAGIGSFVLAVLALAGLGLAPDFTALVVAVVALTVGDTVFTVVVRTLRALLVPEERFASVAGVVVLLNFLSFPLAGVIVLSTGEPGRLQGVALGVAAACLLLSVPLLTSGWWGHLRRAVRGPSPSPEPMTTTTPTRVAPEAARAALSDFLRGEGFSCVAGRSALMQDTLRHVHRGVLAEPAGAAGLYRELAAFALGRDAIDRHLATVVVTFDGPLDLDEAGFEAALWAQLHQLCALDEHDWAAGYDPDPRSARFAVSLAGEPFFVVGLHPAASRLTRRFAMPALVFNSHVQFERLKETGAYARIQREVRRNEMRLQGSLNPALAEFGDVSEAPQYASAAVPAPPPHPLRPASGTTEPVEPSADGGAG